MSTELTISNSMQATSLLEVPDYLRDSSGETGLEGFSKDDIKIPRIKILQGMSPEVRTYQGKAIPGNMWHTILNQQLSSPLRIVPITASKKVFVWTPKKDGGEMVAFSSNAKTWDRGANTEHKVDSIRKGQTWKIGKDVASSGLLEFGSSNSDIENSAPAATLIYEYLCLLPDMMSYSPVAISMSKTALPVARNFNTSMLMLRKPISSIIASVSVIEQSGDDNVWYIPKIEIQGFAPKELYDAAKTMADQFKEYKVEYSDEDASTTKSEKPATTFDDSIPF
jgi:hypothetical protein